MLITCPSCQATYEVGDDDIPEEGIEVECSACLNRWMQMPMDATEIEEAADVEAITAEDAIPSEKETETVAEVSEPIVPEQNDSELSEAELPNGDEPDLPEETGSVVTPFPFGKDMPAEDPPTIPTSFKVPDFDTSLKDVFGGTDNSSINEKLGDLAADIAPSAGWRVPKPPQGAILEQDPLDKILAEVEEEASRASAPITDQASGVSAPSEPELTSPPAQDLEDKLETASLEASPAEAVEPSEDVVEEPAPVDEIVADEDLAEPIEALAPSSPETLEEPAEEVELEVEEVLTEAAPSLPEAEEAAVIKEQEELEEATSDDETDVASFATSVTDEIEDTVLPDVEIIDESSPVDDIPMAIDTSDDIADVIEETATDAVLEVAEDVEALVEATEDIVEPVLDEGAAIDVPQTEDIDDMVAEAEAASVDAIEDAAVSITPFVDDEASLELDSDPLEPDDIVETIEDSAAEIFEAVAQDEDEPLADALLVSTPSAPEDEAGDFENASEVPNEVSAPSAPKPVVAAAPHWSEAVKVAEIEEEPTQAEAIDAADETETEGASNPEQDMADLIKALSASMPSQASASSGPSNPTEEPVDSELEAPIEADEEDVFHPWDGAVASDISDEDDEPSADDNVEDDFEWDELPDTDTPFGMDTEPEVDDPNAIQHIAALARQNQGDLHPDLPSHSNVIQADIPQAPAATMGSRPSSVSSPTPQKPRPVESPEDVSAAIRAQLSSFKKPDTKPANEDEPEKPSLFNKIKGANVAAEELTTPKPSAEPVIEKAPSNPLKDALMETESKQPRSGKKAGLVSVLLLFVAALAVYLLGDALSNAVPALEPYITGFSNVIDSLRLATQKLMGK